MEWLTPIAGLTAAAITVPLLLLLYFLKLKRREQVVSSTLLWRRAVQDLQVNAPFQKIRRNILLLLQMLMLLALLIALAGPALAMMRGKGHRFVLLIDRSAGMNAADVAPSRLDVAKKQAMEFVSELRGKTLFSLTDDSDKVMIVAFDDRAKVMSNFTSDKNQLKAGIEAIDGSDGGSRLAEAVTVSRAFAQSPGAEANDRSAESPAKLVLYSDGRITDLEEIVVASEELVYNKVGQTGENVGITAMQARRSYEDPDEVNVFATISNYCAEDKTFDVQMSLDENVRSIKSVMVGAAKPGTDEEEGKPGTFSLTFDLRHPYGGVVELRLLHEDCLATDNTAWAILSPPKKLAILLVTGGNTVLESALSACPVARLESCTLSQFEAMDHSVMTAEQPYDVIVLDNCVPAELPKCRYLVFGQPPAGIDVSTEGESERHFIMDWRQNHGVMKYVNLENLFVSSSHNLILPRDAEVLAEFGEYPAIGLVRRKGSVFLLVSFDVLESNWPFEPGFVLFCYNATSFLGIQLGQEQMNNLRVGEPIIIEGLAPNVGATVSGPGMSEVEISANAGGTLRLPEIERVGVYWVEVGNEGAQYFCANLADSEESRIEPASEIVLSGELVKAQEKGGVRPNFPLWPFFVMFVLVLACVEWFIYNSKVRI